MTAALSKYIMLLWVVVFGVLAGGCLNLKPQPNPTRQFTLSKIETDPIVSSLNGNAPTIGFRRIGIPEYLKSNKIALRESIHEINYLPFHRWAEPLESGVARLLGEYLVITGTASATFIPPWRSNARFDYVVEVDISVFEGRSDGTVTLDCFYSLYDEKGVRIDRGRFAETGFSWDISQYEALVAAQSSAIESLATHLRERIIAAASPARPITNGSGNTLPLTE